MPPRALRFNALRSGIGNRAAIPGIADTLVTNLVASYGLPATRVIDGIAVSDELKQDLRETHHAT